MPKSKSHRVTLERIKQSRAGENILASTDSKNKSRREFKREASNQRVHFALHDPVGGRVAWGTAILLDYSPQGAMLGHVMFDEGTWPQGNFSISFKVTGGPHEGVNAYGEPLRFATSKSSLAVKFDGIYIKL